MTTGIPLDKAALVSVLLEALLFGFSLPMFAGTIWTLTSPLFAQRVNWKMFTAACLLLLFSTTHFVLNIIRIMQGLIFFRDSYPGGPIGYFSDVALWTFATKNYVLTAQTLVGDAVVIYRCHVVWQSKLIMILPALLWCATAVTGIVTPHIASTWTQSQHFGGPLSRWITSFWTTAFATNLLATLLLICRIWYVDRRAATLRRARNQPSQLRPILHILVDAGVIYSLTLIAALVCFVCQSDGQYVMLDLVTTIIAITFYVVILRVGLATRVNRATSIFGNTPVAGLGEPRRGMLVRVTTSLESKLDLTDSSRSQGIDDPV